MKTPTRTSWLLACGTVLVLVGARASWSDGRAPQGETIDALLSGEPAWNKVYPHASAANKEFADGETQRVTLEFEDRLWLEGENVHIPGDTFGTPYDVDGSNVQTFMIWKQDPGSSGTGAGGGV